MTDRCVDSVFESVLAQADANTSLYARIAPVLSRAGQYVYLVKLLEHAREKLPAAFPLLYDLGVAYFELGIDALSDTRVAPIGSDSNPGANLEDLAVS